MNRVRYISLVSMVAFGLAGCESMDAVMGTLKQGVSKTELLERDRPAIDPQLVPNPLAGNAKATNDPVMTTPPRPNAGSPGTGHSDLGGRNEQSNRRCFNDSN